MAEVFQAHGLETSDGKTKAKITVPQQALIAQMQRRIRALAVGDAKLHGEAG
jgi:hypothetical protein